MKKINQIEPWLGEEEKKELMEVIDSGWFTEAKKTREFERMFAEYVGSKYACAVTSGTTALYVALKSIGIKAGDEVIVPDLTFVASPNAVEMCGAKTVLVDIEKENLCLDLKATEKALTGKTKAIMPVDFNGRCPAMEELQEIADKHSIPLIEDACHTIGSRYKGKHMGTFSKIGVFSFSTPKIITTGQGGMLVTDDKELQNQFMMIKDFGRDIEKKHNMLNAFEHVMLGYNFKFTEFQAAIGIAQMRKLEWRVNRKKEMYKLYTQLLTNIKEVSFVDLDLKEMIPWFNDIILSNGKIRDGLVPFLEEKGIGTRLFYPPIHRLPPYSQLNGNFENTNFISERGLWLPSSTFLTDEDVTRVCDEIRNFFNGNQGALNK